MFQNFNVYILHLIAPKLCERGQAGISHILQIKKPKQWAPTCLGVLSLVRVYEATCANKPLDPSSLTKENFALTRSPMYVSPTGEGHFSRPCGDPASFRGMGAPLSWSSSQGLLHEASRSEERVHFYGPGMAVATVTSTLLSLAGQWHGLV